MVTESIRLFRVPLRVQEVQCHDCKKLIAVVKTDKGLTVRVSLQSPYCKRDEFMVVVEAPSHRNECNAGQGPSRRRR
jgi:phage FluMu protein Com